MTSIKKKGKTNSALVFRDDQSQKHTKMIDEIVVHYKRSNNVEISRSEALRIAIRNEHGRIKGRQPIKVPA